MDRNAKPRRAAPTSLPAAFGNSHWVRDLVGMVWATDLLRVGSQASLATLQVSRSNNELVEAGPGHTRGMVALVSSSPSQEVNVLEGVSGEGPGAHFDILHAKEVFHLYEGGSKSAGVSFSFAMQPLFVFALVDEKWQRSAALLRWYLKIVIEGMGGVVKVGPSQTVRP